MANRSEASYLERSRAFLTPPRSTAWSNPTRSRTPSTILAMALATNQPMTRMMRKAKNLGTKAATLAHASSMALLTLMWAGRTGHALR